MKKLPLFTALLLSFHLFSAIDSSHYPGWPGDEKEIAADPLLLQKFWGPPAKNSGIRTVQDHRALRFVSSRPFPRGYEITSAEKLPVAPGKFLKAAVKLFVEKAQPGSQAQIFLILLDKKGKTLSRHSICRIIDSSPDHMVQGEQYLSLPPVAAAARVSIRFLGNPMTLRIASFKTQTVRAKTKINIEEPFPFPGRKLDDAALDKALASRKKERYALRTNGDMVEFLVNGKPEPLLIFANPVFTYLARTPEFNRKTPELMAAGFNLFSLNVALGVPPNTRTMNSLWLGKKKYQIHVLRKAFRRILQYAPGARIKLNLIITPSPGWAEANPDEIAAVPDGRKLVYTGYRCHRISDTPPQNYTAEKTQPWLSAYWIPSYYSEKFTADAAEAVEDILREFEKTPESKALAAVFLNRGCDGQWFDIYPETDTPGYNRLNCLGDYSPASLKQLKKYIRSKYGNDVKRLRAAWNDPKADFDTVRIPGRKEFFIDNKLVLRRTGADLMSDYIESRGKGMSDQYIALCRAVKKGTGSRVLAGGYSAEGAVTSWPIFTQQCARYMHAAPEVDFLASCPGGRRPYNPVTPALSNGSMRLRGKLAVTELDFRSPTVSHWGATYNSAWYKTHDVNEFRERVLRAQLWSSAAGGTFHAYDMDGNWYDAPSMLEAWKRSNFIQSLRKPAPLGTDRAAIFYSERYWPHMALNQNRAFAHIVIGDSRLAFTRSGINTDIYLLDDIFDPALKAPQLLCFPNAMELTPEKAQLIRKKWGNSGRVIIWMWAPGAGVTTDIGAVAGFKLRRAPGADGKMIMADPKSKDPLMKGVRNLVISSYKPYKLGPVWGVYDPGAAVLGHYAGTKIPAMAVKRYADHTEIFVGQGGALSPELVRNAAREAGVHIWTDGNDPASRAGNLIIVSAASGGKKNIRLKKGMKVKRALTGQLYEVKGNILSCSMKYGEVLVLETE